ncbi:hypothetical protein PP175_19670 [Aneurinibacillus sp. Ricciae_BoGa-3]|uniref:hypothetical protein n=1 Tax=Aneurinibacillus sp. Ricciae_BoGa-3 TaxID=3022697 RepID=UPI0023419E49|nr:hypothetical protein [Aneurinibacillus sp. Ricciae_BoGa-3]WCK53533.1 hypothetical protein PP175_19670 [Aneurinibacillus sp. Ricciae_BoGa-3]
MLDPGELDCYAYSVGMGIDAIMSNDAGAREIIRYESDDQKVVMNFAQLLILGANLGNFTMSQAEQYYEQVKHRNRLNNLANFNHQVSIFNTYTVKHPWVRNNYPSLYR